MVHTQPETWFHQPETWFKPRNPTGNVVQHQIQIQPETWFKAQNPTGNVVPRGFNFIFYIGAGLRPTRWTNSVSNALEIDFQRVGQRVGNRLRRPPLGGGRGRAGGSRARCLLGSLASSGRQLLGSLGPTWAPWQYNVPPYRLLHSLILGLGLGRP